MKYDVIVCGGGIAGISAALSAKRAGAGSVLLMEREFMLGGLATLGCVTIYLPVCDGYGTQVSYGIAEELLKLSASEASQVPIPDCWQAPSDKSARSAARYSCRFDPWLFAIKAEKLLTGAGVQILYGAQVTGTVAENGKLISVVSANREGLREYEADAFVDATGDAVLFDMLGEKTCINESGNHLAAWYYKVTNDKPELVMLGGSESSADGFFSSAGTTSEELSGIMQRTHRAIYADFIKNGGKVPPAFIPSIPQVRMSRRIAGKSAMDIKDTFRLRCDSVGLVSDWKKKGPVYEVPLNALHGDIPNLFAAGRIIASAGEMWDVTRVIPCCAVTGEAAGLAAVLGGNVKAVQNALISRGIPLHINELLKNLPARWVDSHAHIEPGMQSETLLESHAYGYNKIALMSIPCTGNLNENTECLEAKRLEPGYTYVYGGMVYSGNVTPSADNHLAQLKAFMAAGCDGWKLLESKPSVYKRLRIPLDSEVFEKAFAYAEENQIPITWHAGDPATFWSEKTAPEFAVRNRWLCTGEGIPPLQEIYRQVETVLARHPRLKATLAHMYFTTDDPEHAEMLLNAYPNLRFDLTPGSEMYADFMAKPDYWRTFFAKYSRRLVYGSDMTGDPDDIVFGSQHAIVDLVLKTLVSDEEFSVKWIKGRGLGLSKDILDRIFYSNFMDIHGGDPAPLNEEALKEYGRLIKPFLA